MTIIITWNTFSGTRVSEYCKHSEKKTSSPRKILLKSKICCWVIAKNDFQHSGRLPSWIYCDVIILHQGMHFYGPNIVLIFCVDWFCSFWDTCNHTLAVSISPIWGYACAISRDPYVWRQNLTPYLVLACPYSYSLCNFLGTIIKIRDVSC